MGDAGERDTRLACDALPGASCTGVLRCLLLCIVTLALGATPAAASCAPLSEGEQERRADVIFEGAAVGAARAGVTRFAAERYLKGQGPHRVEVAVGPGGGRAQPRGSIVQSSPDRDPRAGERWRVYAARSRGGLRTDSCAGCAVIAESMQWGGVEILRLWFEAAALVVRILIG